MKAPTKVWAEDQLHRLNTLYWVTDKSGKRVKFKTNWAQEALYHQMWYMNVILKARQVGITTFLDLFILDSCLFNADVRAGIIAHNLDDAKVIFRDKIKYPYDQLDEGLRSARRASSDRSDELLFSNNSSIRVATSMRSGTLQLLHVSEYGRISRKYPEKALEIKTGAFEAVGQGQMVFVESTAEGRQGEFYDLVSRAQKLQQAERKLTKLDFRFFFFPWWKHPDYSLSYEEAMVVPISQRLNDYFAALEEAEGIELSRGQKAWYVTKEATHGERMLAEYPSTADEAFEASVEGAYFAQQMAKVRSDKRITKVPHQQGVQVDTWWDLGIGDYMALWFTQTIGREVHVIDYYENCGEGMAHYAALLQSRREEVGYHYGRHVGPHDLAVRELGPGTSRQETARGYGISFEIAPRAQAKGDDIEAARNFLSYCWFDQERCEKGVERLDNYRKAWDDIRGVWKDAPLHDENCHGADAFMVLAKMHHMLSVNSRHRVQLRPAPPTGGWT